MTWRFNAKRSGEDVAFVRDIAGGSLFLRLSWRLSFGELRIVAIARSIQGQSAAGFPAVSCRMSNLNCQYFSGWIFLSGPYSESEVISAWKTAGEPSFRL
jgi:hypothetical protein